MSKKENKKNLAPKEEKLTKTETEKETLTWEKDKKYSAQEAFELTKKLAKVKFDSSVEIHFRLGIDPKKGDQQIRSAVTLPHGTGKQIKVAAFVAPDKQKEIKEAGADIVGGEELIEEIKKSEKTDFDVAIAEPDMMKNLSKIAKILGTRGLMPSPKNETVTTNPVKTVKELKKGKVSFKNDATANLHVMIGKVSFTTEALLENYQTLVDAIKKAKPSGAKGAYFKNISISSTMGPGIKVITE